MKKTPEVKRSWARRLATPVVTTLAIASVPIGLGTGLWFWQLDSTALAHTVGTVLGVMTGMTSLVAAVTAESLMREGPMRDIREGFACKEDKELAYLFGNDMEKVKRFERDDFTEKEAKEIREVWRVARAVTHLIPNSEERRAKFVRSYNEVLGRSIRDSVHLGYSKRVADLLEFRIRAAGLDFE